MTHFHGSCFHQVFFCIVRKWITAFKEYILLYYRQEEQKSINLSSDVYLVELLPHLLLLACQSSTYFFIPKVFYLHYIV